MGRRPESVTATVSLMEKTIMYLRRALELRGRLEEEGRRATNADRMRPGCVAHGLSLLFFSNHAAIYETVSM